jgi:CheY-like chemotaxis protein
LGEGSTFTLNIETKNINYKSRNGSLDDISDDEVETDLFNITSPSNDYAYKFEDETKTDELLFNDYLCLVIEENPNNRMMLYQLLTNLGVKTLTVSSEQEAFLMVKTYNFDIIFLDICIPKKDGMLIYQELRKNVKIPIIATSSIDYAINQITQSLYDDILLKPVKKSALIRILKNLKQQN